MRRRQYRAGPRVAILPTRQDGESVRVGIAHAAEILGKLKDAMPTLQGRAYCAGTPSAMNTRLLAAACRIGLMAS